MTRPEEVPLEVTADGVTVIRFDGNVEKGGTRSATKRSRTVVGALTKPAGPRWNGWPMADRCAASDTFHSERNAYCADDVHCTLLYGSGPEPPLGRWSTHRGPIDVVRWEPAPEARPPSAKVPADADKARLCFFRWAPIVRSPLVAHG